MDYRTYLASDHWKVLKAKKQACTTKRCGICAATTNIDCHHLVYRKLFDVETSDLRWLCRRCHNVAHKLIDDKTITFKPEASHHSMFVSTKNSVKYHLGLHKVNLFWPESGRRKGAEL